MLALALAFGVAPAFGGIVLAYLILTGAYSLGLKNVVLLDAILIAVGFSTTWGSGSTTDACVISM